MVEQHSPHAHVLQIVVVPQVVVPHEPHDVAGGDPAADEVGLQVLVGEARQRDGEFRGFHGGRKSAAGAAFRRENPPAFGVGTPV